MDKLSTTILLKLFPQARPQDIGRGGGEVNGLSKGTEPQNCRRILKGTHVMPHCGFQTHFLVEAADLHIWLRVCEAMKGSPYAEFAVIVDAVSSQDAKQVDNLTERIERYIGAFCDGASPWVAAGPAKPQAEITVEMLTSAALAKLFPQARLDAIGRGGTEVNRLAKGTVPQNCEVLAKGVQKRRLSGTQTHYLVKVDSVLVYLRVCDAMENSGYDEYAVILDVAHADNAAEAARVTGRAQRYIESISVYDESEA